MGTSPFAHITPTPEQSAAMQDVQGLANELYAMIVRTVPPSAERTLAMRALEDAVMWSNKAIVHDGGRYLHLQGRDPDAAPG